jgi:DNA-binding transcriptional LysR family regulator
MTDTNKVMDLKQLQHFVAIYDYGSLLNAARHVAVEQPALTKSLKKLEEHLGLQLFVRHTRELIPTVPGHTLYQKALQVLAEAQDLHVTAQQLITGEQGAVAIGCGPFPTDWVLVPMIQALDKQGVDIRLKVITEDFDKLLHGLLTYQYDFLLFDASKLDELPEPERFQVTPLFTTDLDIVLSKDMYDSLDQSNLIAALTQLKWASSIQKLPQKRINQLPKELQTFYQQQSNAEFIIENVHACLALARAGLAATIAPRAMVKHDVEQGSLVTVTAPFELGVQVGAYRLRSRGINITAQKVIEALKQ